MTTPPDNVLALPERKPGPERLAGRYIALLAERADVLHEIRDAAACYMLLAEALKAKPGAVFFPEFPGHEALKTAATLNGRVLEEEFSGPNFDFAYVQGRLTHLHALTAELRQVWQELPDRFRAQLQAFE